MILSATGVVHNDGSAELFLRSDQNGFSTNVWTVDEMLDNVNTSLYDMNQSGYGELNDDFTELSIHLQLCPFSSFQITVGQDSVIVNLLEEKKSDLAVWSSASNILVAGNPINQGIVLFLGDKLKSVKGGGHSAKLYDGDNLAGFAMGRPFYRVTSPDGYWDYPGIIFEKFIWIGQPPQTPTEYMLRFNLQTRTGSSKELAQRVVISEYTIEEPTHSVFYIWSDHTFYMEAAS